jgi:hypothetical protein
MEAIKDIFVPWSRHFYMLCILWMLNTRRCVSSVFIVPVVINARTCTLYMQPRPHIHHHHWCAHYHNPVTSPVKSSFNRFWLRVSFFLYLSVHFDLILWNTFVHIQSGVIVCNIPKYCILIRLSIIKPWKLSLARCY